MFRFITCTFLLAVGLGAVEAEAQKPSPLPVEDMLSARFFTFRAPVDLSPDGQWVAYTVDAQARREAITDQRYSRFNRNGVPTSAIASTVLLSNIESGETRQLVEGNISTWGASWSPDGNHLAFYSDKDGRAALWIFEKKTGSVRRVSEIIVRPQSMFDVPKWMPDNKRVLVKVLPEGLTIEQAANLFVPHEPQSTSDPVRVAVYPLRANSSTNDEKDSSAEKLEADFTDLALVDTVTGVAQRMVRRSMIAGYSISPDGENFVFSTLNGRDFPRQQTCNFSVVSIRTETHRLLVSNVSIAWGRSMSWSPDGKLIAYITHGPQAKGDCYVVGVSGGEARNLTDGPHPTFGDDYRLPLWDESGKNIYAVGGENLWAISVDKGELKQVTKGLPGDVRDVVAGSKAGQILTSENHKLAYVITTNNKTKRVGFHKVDLATGDSSVLVEEDKAYGSPFCFSVDVSEDGRRIVYVAQDSTRSPDLWVVNDDFRLQRKVTNLNPSFDNYPLGRSQLVEWQSNDGQTLQGTLVLPANYQKGIRYPMIVEVYGDRQGGYLSTNYVNRFGGSSRDDVGNPQLLATRGYAVFMPDVSLKVGTPMKAISDSVLPGINKIIEMGIADPDRLGVTGASYGGYCTLALIAQTTRFKAAVSRSGSGNLLSSYGTMYIDGIGFYTRWAEEGQGSMGGTPWQYRDRYIENSPIFYLDKVETPLLLVSGAADTAVPAFLTDEVFVGMRRLGKEVVYAKYLGGEHTEASFDRVDAIDYFNRMIAWWDKYLKSPETKSKTAEGR